MFKKIIFSFLLAVMLFCTTPVGFAANVNDSFNNKAYGVGMDSSWYSFDLGIIAHNQLDEELIVTYRQKGFGYYIDRVIMIMASLIGTSAILVMIYGGFLILTSAGIQDQYDQGKNYIKYAAIGLLVGIGAYVLVTIVQIAVNTIFFKS